MNADLFTGLNASFPQILGQNDSAFTEGVRRQRWAAWLRVARRSGSRGREMARYWQSHECNGCKHRKGAWCSLAGLPCTVNPFLTFGTGMIGFACMGTGYEEQS